MFPCGADFLFAIHLKDRADRIERARRGGPPDPIPSDRKSTASLRLALGAALVRAGEHLLSAAPASDATGDGCVAA
jgi:hypothetical protein